MDANLDFSSLLSLLFETEYVSEYKKKKKNSHTGVVYNRGIRQYQYQVISVSVYISG